MDYKDTIKDLTHLFTVDYLDNWLANTYDCYKTVDE